MDLIFYIRQLFFTIFLTRFVVSVFSSINLDTNIITSSAGIRRKFKIPAGQDFVSKGIPYRYWTHHTKLSPFRNGLKLGHNVRYVLIVWQRFCEPARLRIAYFLSVCVSVLPLFRVLFATPCLQVKVYQIICDSISTCIATIRNPCKSVNWLLLLVISLPLCQTSCPLRTVHYFRN